MMKYRPLGKTSIEASIISIGGAVYGNEFAKMDEKSALAGLKMGFDRGINYIDTAPWYGARQSETFLGKALRGIPRSNYFIGTKVGRYEKNISSMFDFSAAKTIKSAEQSLRLLNLDYVDLLQVHDVEFAPSIDIILEETLPAVKELQTRGLCRFIGITGYSLSTLRRIVEGSDVKIDTILSYSRLTLLDSPWVGDFGFYDSREIGLINASPLCMGLLADAPYQDWHPVNNSEVAEIKRARSEAVEYCKKVGVNISRIALHYSTSFEQVATTLVSMDNEAIVRDNCDAVLQPLSDKEEQAKEHMLKNIFGKLKVKHWEGIEVERYWKDMKKLGR